MVGPDRLLIARDTPVHRLPAHGKLPALLAYVACVVATPAGAWSVLAVQAAALLAVVALARLPVVPVLRRLGVEVPFLVFAAAMPFVATGPRIDVLGLSLSQAGLLGGATLAAKATLGVLAAIVLSATTSAAALLAALERLRLPSAFVAIAAFMLRYAGIVGDDVRRAGVARASRGASGRLGHLRATAGGVGTLFVRSYERGERVQRAMLARGYTGRMPDLGPVTSVAESVRGGLLWCATLPAAALAALLVGAAAR